MQLDHLYVLWCARVLIILGSLIILINPCIKTFNQYISRAIGGLAVASILSCLQENKVSCLELEPILLGYEGRAIQSLYFMNGLKHFSQNIVDYIFDTYEVSNSELAPPFFKIVPLSEEYKFCVGKVTTRNKTPNLKRSLLIKINNNISHRLANLNILSTGTICQSISYPYNNKRVDQILSQSQVYPEIPSFIFFFHYKNQVRCIRNWGCLIGIQKHKLSKKISLYKDSYKRIDKFIHWLIPDQSLNINSAVSRLSQALLWGPWPEKEKVIYASRQLRAKYENTEFSIKSIINNISYLDENHNFYITKDRKSETQVSPTCIIAAIYNIFEPHQNKVSGLQIGVYAVLIIVPTILQLVLTYPGKEKTSTDDSFYSWTVFGARSGNGGTGSDHYILPKNLKTPGFGTPSGGHGGSGGSIVLCPSIKNNKISKNIVAQNGYPGHNKFKSGATGPNRILDLPFESKLFLLKVQPNLLNRFFMLTPSELTYFYTIFNIPAIPLGEIKSCTTILTGGKGGKGTMALNDGFHYNLPLHGVKNWNLQRSAYSKERMSDKSYNRFVNGETSAPLGNGLPELGVRGKTGIFLNFSQDPCDIAILSFPGTNIDVILRKIIMYHDKKPALYSLIDNSKKKELPNIYDSQIEAFSVYRSENKNGNKIGLEENKGEIIFKDNLSEMTCKAPLPNREDTRNPQSKPYIDKSLIYNLNDESRKPLNIILLPSICRSDPYRNYRDRVSLSKFAQKLLQFMLDNGFDTRRSLILLRQYGNHGWLDNLWLNQENAKDINMISSKLNSPGNITKNKYENNKISGFANLNSTNDLIDRPKRLAETYEYNFLDRKRMTRGNNSQYNELLINNKYLYYTWEQFDRSNTNGSGNELNKLYDELYPHKTINYISRYINKIFFTSLKLDFSSFNPDNNEYNLKVNKFFTNTIYRSDLSHKKTMEIMSPTQSTKSEIFPIYGVTRDGLHMNLNIMGLKKPLNNIYHFNTALKFFLVRIYLPRLIPDASMVYNYKIQKYLEVANHFESINKSVIFSTKKIEDIDSDLNSLTSHKITEQYVQFHKKSMFLLDGLRDSSNLIICVNPLELIIKQKLNFNDNFHLLLHNLAESTAIQILGLLEISESRLVSLILVSNIKEFRELLGSYTKSSCTLSNKNIEYSFVELTKLKLIYFLNQNLLKKNISDNIIYLCNSKTDRIVIVEEESRKSIKRIRDLFFHLFN